MNSVKFTENYTLTYLDPPSDPNYIELKSTELSPLKTISKSELETLNLTNSAEPPRIENQAFDFVSATESILHQLLDSATNSVKSPKESISKSEVENNNLSNLEEYQRIEDQAN